MCGWSCPWGWTGRRRIRRGGYPSRKAALEVLARLRNPKAGGTGGVVTVGDWLAHWLVSRTSPAASYPGGEERYGGCRPRQSRERRSLEPLALQAASPVCARREARPQL